MKENKQNLFNCALVYVAALRHSAVVVATKINI